MATLANLVVQISGNTVKLNRALDKSQSRLSKFGGRAGGALKAIGPPATVAAGAILGIGAAAVSSAAKLERGLAEVNTLVGGDASYLKQLQQQTLDFSKETGIATDQVVPALYQSISAGVPPDNVFQFMRESATAAIGGVADLSDVIGVTTSTLKAYGLEMTEAARVQDQFLTVVKLGVTTLPELGRNIGKVAPLAATLGVSVEELNAGFATLTGVTGNTAEVATQLRAVYQALLKPTGAMEDAIAAVAEQIGLQGEASGQALIENLGFQRTLQLLEQTTGGNTAEFGLMLGSVEALNAGLALTGSQADTFSTKLNGIQEATGASQEAADLMNETFSRQFELLKNELSVELTRLGTELLPLMTVLLKALIPVVRGVISVLRPFLDAARALGHAIDSNNDKLEDQTEATETAAEHLARYNDVQQTATDTAMEAAAANDRLATSTGTVAQKVEEADEDLEALSERLGISVAGIEAMRSSWMRAAEEFERSQDRTFNLYGGINLLTEANERLAEAFDLIRERSEAATEAFVRQQQMAQRHISGFVEAGALGAPPSLFGGLDAIRRGLNVDFQAGVIDFDTHQALLNDATRAFGGTGLPAFADGGIVRRPTLGLFGEAGPEAIVPLDQFMGGGLVINYISITVEQAIASDSLELGEVIVREVQDAVDRGDLELAAP